MAFSRKRPADDVLIAAFNAGVTRRELAERYAVHETTIGEWRRNLHAHIIPVKKVERVERARPAPDSRRTVRVVETTTPGGGTLRNFISLPRITAIDGLYSGEQP